MRGRSIILVIGFLLVAFFGYWLAGTAAPRHVQKDAMAQKAVAPKRTVITDEPAPKFKRTIRVATFRSDDEATEAGAVPGQRILMFKDQASLEEFLKRAGDSVKVLGRLDALNALKIGFTNFEDLAGLLSGQEDLSFVYPVEVPTNPEGTAQAGATSLGARLLEWLGITEDNSSWGKGVKIAILDTGVLANQAFKSKIFSQYLVEMPTDLSLMNGHGTAVASMIIGDTSLTPGVAPGATILSFRIADDNGYSDSAWLAQGIVAAADAGAQLINISMGSIGDSPLVRKAIEYANAKGALIIAAAGNNGTNRVSYPAANDGVIAVGAVDASGDHLDFSNAGNKIAASAPGFGINAAWLADQAASVSGTSFSAPIMTGAIAAVMTHEGVTQQQAVNLLFAYLNDTGAAGADPQTGAGTLDIGRVFNRNTPGIYDAAVASQRVLPPSATAPNGQIEVLVQNRGTEPLVNTAVTISTPFGKVNANITTLAPNGVQVIRVPIIPNYTGDLRYGSKVTLSGGIIDSKPSNDQRIDQYVPAGK